MSGKGDVPRPYSVAQQAYYDSWERTFRKTGRVIGTCGHELACLPEHEDTTALTALSRDGSRAVSYATMCLSCYTMAQREGRVLATPAEQDAWLDGALDRPV